MKSYFALATVSAATLFAQGTASGTLTINKDTFQMKYSAAVPTKDGTRIVVGDQPIPLDALEEESEIWDLKSKGFHGLQLDLTSDRNSVSTFVISDTLGGASLSGSRSGDLAKQSTLANGKVDGAFSSKVDELGNNKCGYDLKFSAPITPLSAQPAPADAVAAATKESTKAYLALAQAIRTGNKAAILAAAPADKRAMMDTPDFPQMLKVVQAMQPANIKVLKATETGDNATLIVSGTEGGKPQRGKVKLTRTAGKWIMASESWRAQ